MQATVAIGLPVSGVTHIKLIKVVFICVALIKEQVHMKRQNNFICVAVSNGKI